MNYLETLLPNQLAVWGVGVFISLLLHHRVSICVYRLFFHRLHKAGFKGPIIIRISELEHSWKCRNNGNHTYLESVRRQYGDFVRTGPSEVTVFDPRVFSAIDSPRSECIKSEFYELLHPHQSLVTVRDKEIHLIRRRDWVKGFSVTEVVKHQQKISSYAQQLDVFLCSNSSTRKSVNMNDMCYWYGFDIRGEIVFTKSFDMLRTGKWHHIIERIQHAISLLGPLAPSPWLLQLGLRMGPRIGALKDWVDMRDWCENQIRQRIDFEKSKSYNPDLAHFLMEEKKGCDIQVQENSWLWCRGDSMLAIIAGSDQTATSLIGCYCELAKCPEQVEKLYKELGDVDPKDVKSLTALKHLNAVLYEAMRLHPALLSGGSRKTQKDGIWVGEVYIPPETTVVAPRYSIQRRDDCFVHPNEFIPEHFHQPTGTRAQR